ncbi:hypothetical protein BJY59DRAFT_698700 [Rhodotorula toruloides]
MTSCTSIHVAAVGLIASPDLGRRRGEASPSEEVETPHAPVEWLPSTFESPSATPLALRLRSHCARPRHPDQSSTRPAIQRNTASSSSPGTATA